MNSPRPQELLEEVDLPTWKFTLALALKLQHLTNSMELTNGISSSFFGKKRFFYRDQFR